MKYENGSSKLGSKPSILGKPEPLLLSHNSKQGTSNPQHFSVCAHAVKPQEESWIYMDEAGFQLGVSAEWCSPAKDEYSRGAHYKAANFKIVIVLWFQLHKPQTFPVFPDPLFIQ